MKSTRLGRPGQQLAILVAAALLLAGGGSSNAFEITQPIPGTNLTACLDVAGGSTAAQTPVDAKTDVAAKKQRSSIGECPLTCLGAMTLFIVALGRVAASAGRFVQITLPA